MRNIRIGTCMAALGTSLLLLTATGCEGGSSTTGGTSGTNGGASGGATRVGPPPTNPRIFASPGVCYKGGTMTFTITGGEPLGEYPVQLRVTDGGPVKMSWVKTADEAGQVAGWKVKCDNLPSNTYEVVTTWDGGKQSSKAAFDILREG